MPYRVQISLKTCEEHHEAYFKNLPAQQDVLKSVEVDREIADEAYSNFYDQVEELVDNFNWPTRWDSMMSGLGMPAYRSGREKERLPVNASGFIRIHRFEFTE